MNKKIFEFFQAMQMPLELCVAPAGVPAHVAAAKTKVLALDLLPLALRAHHFVHEQQQPSRLRWKFVERASQHFMRQPVSRGDIVERHFDVFERLACAWPFCVPAGAGATARWSG